MVEPKSSFQVAPSPGWQAISYCHLGAQSELWAKGLSSPRDLSVAVWPGLVGMGLVSKSKHPKRDRHVMA